MTVNGASRVAVVTGASRGAGRGIAAALAARDWRVYGTSRTISDAPPGVVAVRVDHGDDDAVKGLFDRVQDECGRLDLLVNNAAAISDALVSPKPFWEKPLELADVLDVGLRSSYVASWCAAPLLVAAGRGLIAFTSSPGSVCYMHGPAYGAQKAGVDKMVADMAVDFRGTGVATVSIWMGILLTEKLRAAFSADPAALAATAEHAETPEFTGHLIHALFCDPHLEELSGQALIGAELAERYGITDEGGRRPPSHREMLGSPRTPSSVVVR
ncbi:MULTISPECIES: SDR family NAD(P)-dependent oxidoreductase [Mycobacterium avium complex (MAC)]|jgi:NAD(P)-dependent dehydrogenase (short-subunit alcohol dehydrogenase family)|uniref:Short-chain dehydrogenase n=1 Tax=Mycobacterium paraintracellulare TaxID=1138383 RepID=A0ABN6AYF7_9MYCO|nr:SDR family NAD(P)-dependent oxidoreductase [Mycobacterium paraintracellulare]AFC54244.1 short chain dehydrogenase/reductase SDR [Mycobacterium paraintracellulare]OSC26502.1 short-chain dehydrogenase [Mycobacterium paraintracellulare]BBY72408.1 short-chain dehydrogenase [Mycobacterium paraintracellulare]BCO41863.1 short-chain dehydrogenase [Mycobacterium paraintracellulare]